MTPVQFRPPDLSSRLAERTRVVHTRPDDQGGAARPSTALRHPAELGAPACCSESAPAPPLAHLYASPDLRAAVTNSPVPSYPLAFPCTARDCSLAWHRPAPPLRSHAAVLRPCAKAVARLATLRAFPWTQNPVELSPVAPLWRTPASISPRRGEVAASGDPAPLDPRAFDLNRQI